MRKNWLCSAFCALFLLFLLVPGILTLVLGPSEAGANEQLSRAPQMIKAGSVNYDVLSDACAYFDDHFAMRQQFITANAALTAALFHESASQDVTLGRDGWLFYAETLEDFEGSSPMTERQLYCAAHTLSLMQEYAASQNCAFVFAAAPNKNSLYPEYMPARYEKSQAPSNLTRLAALLSREGVNTCDLSAHLLTQDEPVYFKTDSHWTGFGSALAHDALLAALGRGDTLSQEDFTPQPHLGDLYEMLCPAGTETEPGLALSRARTFSYVGAVHGPDDMTIRTICSGQTGRLLMFRDSFGNALHEDMAESFAAACFSRAMPYDLTLLEQEAADTLVIELVERNLSKLASQPPIMPGPVRELAAPENTVPAQLTLAQKQSALDGCVQYTGTLSCDSMDDDSPVYVLLDGKAYEACPTQDGFSLHAPAAQKIEVFVVVNGTLVRCAE